MRGTNAEAEQEARAAVARGETGCAIKILVRAYQHELFRFCCRQLGNGAAAEDVLQTTFMRAYEGIGAFEARGAFRAWLFTIVRHRCIDYMRASQRSTALRDSATTHPLEEGVAIAESIALLRCLSELAPAAREAVLLKYEDGFTYPELARMLEENETTLAMRVARALAALRRCIGLDGGLT